MKQTYERVEIALVQYQEEIFCSGDFSEEDSWTAFY